VPFPDSDRTVDPSAWDWHLLVIALSYAALEGEPMSGREAGEACLESLLVDRFLDVLWGAASGGGWTVIGGWNN
jgi:hypothetical protein